MPGVSNTYRFTGLPETQVQQPRTLDSGSRGIKRKSEDMSDSSDCESVACNQSIRNGPWFDEDLTATRSSSSATNVTPPALKTDSADIFRYKNSNFQEMIAAEREADLLVEELDKSETQPPKEQTKPVEAAVTTVEEAPSVIAEEAVKDTVVQEPPRKKVKINDGGSVAKSSRATTAFKYTVATLAGATFGALGTIVGLASLPADYFA